MNHKHNGKACGIPIPVKCTCNDEVEVEMVELTGEQARKFIEAFGEIIKEDECGCGLHVEHTGKHAPDIEKERPTRPETGHTMEEGAVIGCPWCCYLAEIKGKLHS